MTETFPWTEEQVEELFKGFSGNTSFSVKWPWAPFHSTGFRALRWAAFNNLSVPDFYNILDSLSVPGAPKKYFKDLQNAGVLDFEERMIPLNPALAIKQTFKMSKENFQPFKKQELVLLSVNDLLSRNPKLEELWRPVFDEDFSFIEKWMAKDYSLLNSFHVLTAWNQLKVVECLVGVAKSSSILNFERIY